MKDAQKAALNELGYAGSNQDMENQFLTDSLGKKVPNNQGMYEWLGTLGFSVPSLQDRLKAYLISLGYAGTLNGMLKLAFQEKTFYNAIRALFNRIGSNAHRYMAGVSPSGGFTPGNYQDSSGTTQAVVDAPVGLVLDAAGSLGAEIITANFAAGDAGSLVTNNAGVVTVQNNDSTAAYTAANASAVVGKTYRLTYTLVSKPVSSPAMIIFGGYNSGSAINPGTYTIHVTASGTGGLILANGSSTVNGESSVWSGVSVKEVTGIHASQSTAGYKPVLRRGIVNLLTWSNDLTNAVWQALNGASKAGQVITLGSTYATYIAGSNIANALGNTYTAAVILSGTPGVQVYISLVDLGGAYPRSSQQITLSASPTMYLVTRIGVTQANVALQITDSGQATSVTFGGAGVFQGTYTAAQILAAGGIPLTTTAAASSSLGPYWHEYDGAKLLALGSSPFGGLDDHAVVVAFNATAANTYAFSNAKSGTLASVCSININANGYVQLYYKDDAGTTVYVTDPVDRRGTDIVVAGWKVGNLITLRINGVQKATSSTPLGATTTDNWQLGALVSAGQLKGRIYDGNLVKGTLTLADIKTLEKAAAAKSAGITL